MAPRNADLRYDRPYSSKKFHFKLYCPQGAGRCMRRQCPRGGDDLGEVLVGAEEGQLIRMASLIVLTNRHKHKIYILQVDKASYFNKS